jgi:hypothetical protein
MFKKKQKVDLATSLTCDGGILQQRATPLLQ